MKILQALAIATLLAMFIFAFGSRLNKGGEPVDSLSPAPAHSPAGN